MFALGLKQVVGDLHVPEGAFRLHAERSEVLVGVFAVVHDHGARFPENQLYKLLIVTMFVFDPMTIGGGFVEGEGESGNALLLENPRKEDYFASLNFRSPRIARICADNIFWRRYFHDFGKFENSFGCFGFHRGLNFRFLDGGEEVGGCLGLWHLQRQIREDAFGEGLELQFVEDGFELLRVGTVVGHLVEVVFHRDVYHDGSQLFGEEGLLLVLVHEGTGLLVVLVEVAGVHLLDAAVVGEQFLGAHLSDAWHAGDVVGGITPQTEHIDQLLRSFDLIFLANFGHTENLCWLSELAGLVHADVVGDELPVVLVGGEHQYLKALDFSVFGQRTDQIVRLVAVNPDHADLESVEDAFDVGNRLHDVVGCGLAVLLVVLVLHMPEGGCARVEGHRHVGRFLVLEYLVQRVGKAEHRGGVQPFGGESRTFDHRVVRSEYQAHSIYQEDFFRHCLSLFLGKAKVQKIGT